MQVSMLWFGAFYWIFAQMMLNNLGAGTGLPKDHKQICFPGSIISLQLHFSSSSWVIFMFFVLSNRVVLLTVEVIDKLSVEDENLWYLLQLISHSRIRHCISPLSISFRNWAQTSLKTKFHIYHAAIDIAILYRWETWPLRVTSTGTLRPLVPRDYLKTDMLTNCCSSNYSELSSWW